MIVQKKPEMKYDEEVDTGEEIQVDKQYPKKDYDTPRLGGIDDELPANIPTVPESSRLPKKAFDSPLMPEPNRHAKFQTNVNQQNVLSPNLEPIEDVETNLQVRKMTFSDNKGVAFGRKSISQPSPMKPSAPAAKPVSNNDFDFGEEAMKLEPGDDFNFDMGDKKPQPLSSYQQQDFNFQDPPPQE